ncbi:hypothetical protein L345_16023, partial [Ophiophagus hannah]
MKWFFQCFLDRTPFRLTLRIWDIYILEGERVLTAMAYTILKLHRNFFFDDDFVIEQLQSSMAELKRAKMDVPVAALCQEEEKRQEEQVESILICTRKLEICVTECAQRFVSTLATCTETILMELDNSLTIDDVQVGKTEKVREKTITLIRRKKAGLSLEVEEQKLVAERGSRTWPGIPQTTNPSKEDEFPKKLGKIPADSQPAMLNLTHLVNGQKTNSVPKEARASQRTGEGRREGSPRRYGEGGQESSPTARTKRDREGSPTPRAERGRESSPNRQRRKNSLEKRPTLRHQQKPVTLNTQSGLPKHDGENPRRKPEAQTETDPNQKHNATANQNSNAALTTGKEFVPRWIKPSDVKIIEKTTKITMEFKTRSPKQGWTGTGPAPEDEAQLFNLKQKVRIWDVDESKRGSNASQYDNVPEADLENGNLMEQVTERVVVPSPRSTVFSSGSRKEIEKGSSPPKISNSYVFSSQPRVPRYSSQSDGSVVGPHMRQPPPSYNNPPVYQGYSPKHVTKVGNSAATQYNHGTRTSSTTQLHIPDFLPEMETHQVLSERPPRNYSALHQNLVVTPSSRIEILPDEVFPSSPRGLRPAIPPVDYVPDHKKWPDPPLMYRPGAYGQSWGGDGGQSHFSNLKRHPAFQAKPLEDPNLPTLSVDRPLRYRTASGELGPPSYQYPSSPGPDHHYRHQADGLSMNESVLL